MNDIYKLRGFWRKANEHKGYGQYHAIYNNHLGIAQLDIEWVHFWDNGYMVKWKEGHEELKSLLILIEDRSDNEC